MKSRIVVCALTAALLLQACSSRPREFTPTLAGAASQSEFEAAYATCNHLFVAGKLDSSGRDISLGAGAAAGAATAAVGTTAAAATASYAGLAVLGATVVLLPFAILGGAFGMSRMKRTAKEKAIKTAMEGCLGERGYKIAGWSKGTRKPVIVQPGTATN